MTSDDEMPWSAPWTVRRGAQDEAAFVADVSGALHVPDAAPEIRMIAEVMAVLDIPSQPERGRTVADLLAEERERQAGGVVVPIRRFVIGRRVAGVAAAAAVALGLLTASAFAGVLPDSIQKVAHSVINAPAPQDSPGKPSDKPTEPANRDGGSGNGWSGTQPGPGSTGGSGAPAPAATSGKAATPGDSAAPSDVPASSSEPTGSNTVIPPTGSASNNGNNGKGHKTQAPSVQQAPGPSETPDPTRSAGHR